MAQQRFHRALIGLTALSALVLSGCAAQDGTTSTVSSSDRSSEAASTEAAPHWGYEGEGAPEHWGSLATDYASCGTGQEQSPINLAGATPADLDDVDFAYVPSAGEVLNNGHTLQFSPAATQRVTLGGESLELAQLHMHAPSEHEIDGKQLAGEIHFVHSAADGSLTVLGVLLEQGEENALVQYLLDNAPATIDEAATTTADIDIASALPSNREYITYSGSLTTPPCTENVRWIVMTQPVHASAQQLAEFAALIGPNARPVQELGERELTLDATS